MSKSFFVLLVLSVATLCSALRSVDQSSQHAVRPVIQNGCTDMCHHLTSGPCQHPDENNEVCMEKNNVNGTVICPSGMYDCGPRPVRSGPSPPPSKSATETPSLSATSSPAISTTRTASRTVSTTASRTATVTRTPSPSASRTSSVTPSRTASNTASRTVTVTPSTSPRPSSSRTPTRTSTRSPTRTPTRTRTSSPSKTPSSSKISSVISGPDGLLRGNTLVTNRVYMPQNNYRISFDMNIDHVEGNWANIFHFTGGQANYGGENRVPALWFYPGQLKFHWICGVPSSTNQEVRSSYIFNLNQNYHIDLQVLNGIATIWVDGAVTNGIGQSLGPFYNTQYAQLWMADPWYAPAGASVTNFVVTEL